MPYFIHTYHTHLHVAEGLLAFESPSSIAQSRAVITALPQRAPVEPRDHQEPLGVFPRSQQPNNVLVPNSVHIGSSKVDTSNTTILVVKKITPYRCENFAPSASRAIGVGGMFQGLGFAVR